MGLVKSYLLLGFLKPAFDLTKPDFKQLRWKIEHEQAKMENTYTLHTRRHFSLK